MQKCVNEEISIVLVQTDDTIETDYQRARFDGIGPGSLIFGQTLRVLFGN